MLHLNEHFHQK